MCNHSPNREAAMVTVRDGVWCDPCLEQLIRALNDGDLATVASCCGHGYYPGWVMLADGRVLTIAPDLDYHHRAAEVVHRLVDGCQPGQRCEQHPEEKIEAVDLFGEVSAEPPPLFVGGGDS